MNPNCSVHLQADSSCTFIVISECGQRLQLCLTDSECVRAVWKVLLDALQLVTRESTIMYNVSRVLCTLITVILRLDTCKSTRQDHFSTLCSGPDSDAVLFIRSVDYTYWPLCLLSTRVYRVMPQIWICIRCMWLLHRKGAGPVSHG